MIFYETISAVQAAYLAKAKASESPTQAVKIGDTIKASSTSAKTFAYAESCPVAVTGRVANKHIKDGKVQDEAPILVTSDTGDFLGGETQLYCFTTPGLGEDNLKPTSIVSGGVLKTWSEVTLKAGHNFMIKSKPVTVTMYRSTIDGQLYVEADLPEQTQSKCLEKYTADVKAERNARIADTDDLAKLEDMTVKVSTQAQRRALTTDERTALTTYRQALRDLPEAEGFPFVDFPEIPEALELYLTEKIDQRSQQMNMQGGLNVNL